MIDVEIVKIGQKILTIQAKGHSGYAESGSDIVCSAVSTVMHQTLVGLVEVAKAKVDYSVDENIPFMRISIKQHDNNTDLLMQTAELSLINLEQSYPKFIKIKESKND